MTSNCRGQAVAINPLSWSTGTAYVPKEGNPGSLVEQDGTYVLTPGLHDAQVDTDRGSVTCRTCTDYLPIEGFGDVCLHGHDYDLYFKSIHDNGYVRSAKYLGHDPLIDTD